MATGRPIEFDPDEVVASATAAFWSKGYEATSLQDLLDATGLSKSSLYQSFGGKQQLFGRCISAYTDRMVALLLERLGDSDSAMQFIDSVLTEIGSEGARGRRPIGCLVMNTASEFGQRERGEWRLRGGLEDHRTACGERGASKLTWQTAKDNARAQKVYDRVGGHREELLEYSLDVD